MKRSARYFILWTLKPLPNVSCLWIKEESSLRTSMGSSVLYHFEFLVLDTNVASILDKSSAEMGYHTTFLMHLCSFLPWHG